MKNENETLKPKKSHFSDFYLEFLERLNYAPE